MADFRNLEGHTEEILKQHGYRAYTHKDEGDAVFWSKTDLLETDDFKKWFLA